jgi:hypothetical protein
MPIHTDWDNEGHTVIRIQVTDPWEIDEYSQATLHAWSLMETVDYSVHLIIDFTHVYTFPKNMLSGAPAVNSHIHPRQSLVIGVKINPFFRGVMRVATRVFPRLGNNLFFTQTVPEAYELITKYAAKPPQ